jgi:hypothetical protein
MINESQARQPAKEYTEFIEKPVVREATQVQTQYVHQNVQEQPIKVKEQPIQQVERNTVVKEQPIIHRTQEIQVQQEKPIEVVKQNVSHQTMPAIEEKQTVVQPVRSGDTQMKTVQAGPNSVTAPSRDAAAISSVQVDERTGEHGFMEKMKEKVGGVKQSAHGALESAREKAHEVFGGHNKDTTTSTTSRTTTGTGYSH